MEQKQITATYAEAVKEIKEAILESRYRAARLVNKEVLALYYAIGGYISVQSRAARWGSNAIGTISELLQQELPGLTNTWGLFCLTDSADGAAGQTGRTVPECLPGV